MGAEEGGRERERAGGLGIAPRFGHASVFSLLCLLSLLRERERGEEEGREREGESGRSWNRSPVGHTTVFSLLHLLS